MSEFAVHHTGHQLPWFHGAVRGRRGPGSARLVCRVAVPGPGGSASRTAERRSSSLVSAGTSPLPHDRTAGRRPQASAVHSRVNWLMREDDSPRRWYATQSVINGGQRGGEMNLFDGRKPT